MQAKLVRPLANTEIPDLRDTILNPAIKGTVPRLYQELGWNFTPQSPAKSGRHRRV